MVVCARVLFGTGSAGIVRRCVAAHDFLHGLTGLESLMQGYRSLTIS